MSAAARLLGMIRRGVLTSSRLVDGALRLVQARVGGTTVDDVELMEPYGLAAVAPAGADVVIVHAGADESHPLALATSHRSHRPNTLTAGQVALYDSTGKVVTLSTSGIQLGTGASKGVARNTDTVSVTIPANTVAVGFSGGTAVMNALPITLTGTITSGSATVKAVD